MAQEDLFSGGLGGPTPGPDAPDAPGAGLRGASFFEAGQTAPLAARMRPRSLDEIAGQAHLLSEGKPLRRLVEGSGAASVILYGPP